MSALAASGVAIEIITLDTAKDCLRVDGIEQDAEIAGMVMAAQAVVEDFLGRPLIDAVLGWPTVETLPVTIVQAIKIVLVDLYDNRETALRDLTTVRNLIGRHVVVSFG